MDTESSERMTDIRKVYNILEKLEQRRPQVSPLHRWEENFTRRTMYEQCNMEVRSCNHFCNGKVLVIQHAMRMRHIILPPVACPAVPHFPTLPQKGTIFGEKSY